MERVSTSLKEVGNSQNSDHSGQEHGQNFVFFLNHICGEYRTGRLKVYIIFHKL